MGFDVDVKMRFVVKRNEDEGDDANDSLLF